MFTKRIIPCLDVNDGRVVKGVNFVNLRDAGDPVEIAAAYDKAGPTSWYFWISRPPRTTGGLWWTWCAGWRRPCLSRLPWAEVSARWRISAAPQGGRG